MTKSKLPDVLDEWLHTIVVACPSCGSEDQDGVYHEGGKFFEWALQIADWTPEIVRMGCVICGFTFFFPWDAFKDRFLGEMHDLEKDIQSGQEQDEEYKEMLEDKKRCAALFDEWPGSKSMHSL